MKAIVLENLSGPSGLVVRDVEEPDASGKVLIDVRAAGVNYPDLLMTQGAYQMKVDPPFVPGAEVSGVVRVAPVGSVFKMGDRVLALCGLGGYAQTVSVDPSMVLPAPDELDLAHGVALVANHQTAYFALVRRARLLRGETVVVLGAAGGWEQQRSRSPRGLVRESLLSSIEMALGISCARSVPTRLSRLPTVGLRWFAP